MTFTSAPSRFHSRFTFYLLIFLVIGLCACGGNANVSGAIPSKTQVPNPGATTTATTPVPGTPGVPIPGTPNVPTTPAVLVNGTTFPPGTTGTTMTGTGTTTGTTGTTTTGTTGNTATSPTPATKNPGTTSTLTNPISGTVVNAQTNQPIQGTVAVALEAPTTNGFVVIAQTTADANGNFSFANVSSSTALAVVISAQEGSNFFIPVIVAGGGSGIPSTASFATATPIVPGTNIGTIGLTVPGGQNSILVSTTSPNPMGLQEVIEGVSFVIPLPNPTVVAGQVAVPAFQAQLAGFNPAGMVFTPTSQITVATVP